MKKGQEDSVSYLFGASKRQDDIDDYKRIKKAI